MRRLLPLLAALCMVAGCVEDTRLTMSPDPTPTPRAYSIIKLPEVSGQDNLYSVTAREFLSLRIRPDSSADRVKKLAPGAVVHILEEHGEFVLVEEVSTGYTGYVLRKYLEQAPAGFSAPTPAPEGAPGLYRVQAEEFISLRAGADTAAERLAVLEAGSIVEVTGFSGNFAHVNADGLSGYALAAYLEPVHEEDAPPSGAGVYVAEGDVYYVGAENYLSLRIEPDASSTRIAKLPRGERIVLYEVVGDFAYVEAEATGERGYVLRDRLLTPQEWMALPEIVQADIRYVDALEYLTLREDASTAAREIEKVARGERVTVIKRAGDFAYVTVEATGSRGYMLDGYLSAGMPKGLPAAGGMYTVLAEEYVSLRVKPSTTAERAATIPAGEKVKVTGYDGLFSKVTYGDMEGYVLSGYLTRGDAPLGHLSIVKETATYAPHAIGEDLSALAKLYPDRLRVVSTGRSLEGRDIPAAMLGNPSAEHHVLVQAGIHGREHMTSLLVMAQIEDMLARQDAVYQDMTYAKLLDEVCFHIMPTANPDGIVISQTRKATPALEAIYKADTAAGLTTLSLDDYLRAWKANAAGVDINRNFDAGWKTLAGPNAPSSSRYKGVSAHDQPETQALAAYTMKYDFDATVSYHAYGSVLYWEYGSDAATLEGSRRLARTVREVTRYPLAGAGGLDAGGYKDWAMEMRSIPSVTIEIGTRECPLPIDEFPAIWERNRDVLPAVGVWALS